MKFTAEQIAALLQGNIKGNSQAEVWDIAKLEDASAGRLCFLFDEKYIHYLPDTKATIVVMTRSIPFEENTSATLILVDNARAAMGQLLKMVEEVMRPRKKGIEQPVYVAENVQLPADIYLGAFAYVGKNVTLGKNVQIYPQCYLGDNVKIGDNTILYAGVKVYADCVIGNDCILHSGVVIGADGFGFEPDQNGVNQKIPQLGNVIIEDDVEIGANTTIDRAIMGSTIVHTNVKLDNLVQVAHNVEVGKSTFMCAQVGVAGSTKIGEHCILAGQVGVSGHIEIADNCIFGAKSGISNHVRKAGQYQGSPIQPALQWRKSVVGFKNLPEIMKIVNELEKNK